MPCPHAGAPDRLLKKHTTDADGRNLSEHRPEAGPGDQPVPRPTLPAGGRIGDALRIP
ncbi:hypothetical protein RGUI_1864 [Rhodovulum sp. P5]|nr:hypothetical protein RGUI_1864 [Rhodovulum sp. P5]